MNLTIPTVATDPGPDWAFNLNNSLTIIDGHNHTTNEGVRVPTDGININADLTFNDFNATSLRSSRYSPELSPLSTPSDLSCVYVSGVDLWYNDSDGNQIRLTESGAPAGTPGSITNLVPPAAVTYDPPSQTFIFTSAANTPANVDVENVVLRNFVANSKGLTLKPPAAMAANYSITLPALPASTKIMQITSSGVITDVLGVDGTTIQIVGNNLTTSSGVYSYREFLANGNYSGATFPQTEVDGLFFFPFNATISSVWIFNQTPGASGTTEFDLKRATSSGGAFSSMLTTTGKVLSTAAANVWTDSGAVIAPQTGVTKPVLSSTTVSAGDAIRFDLIQSMASPAETCGMVVYYIPR
jgi:hypothetical protein